MEKEKCRQFRPSKLAVTKHNQIERELQIVDCWGNESMKNYMKN